MDAKSWEVCSDPWEMLDQMPGVCSTRRQGLWAAACCRRVWQLLDSEHRSACEAVEASLERTDCLVGVVSDVLPNEQARREALSREVSAAFSSEAAWSDLLDHFRRLRSPSQRATSAIRSLINQLYKGAAGDVADALAQVETGFTPGSAGQDISLTYREAWRREQRFHADLLRDIVGNPFRTATFDPAWRTSDVMLLAQGIYEERAFDRMPILADALQDAGCGSEDILSHCRDPQATHVRGCWVVDLVLGKS